MSEEKQPSSKGTLTMSRPKKLQLTKTVEGGKVKQNFTHGRSKSVTVEVRKTRTFARKDGEGMVAVEKSLEESPGAQAFAATHPAVRDKQQIQKATSQVQTQKDADEKKQQQDAAASDVVTGPSEREGAAVRPAEPPRGPRPDFASPTPTRAEPAAAKRKEAPAKKKIRLKGDDHRRSSGKITVSQALEYQEERMRSLASVKRQREKARRAELGDGSGGTDKVIREVVIPEFITVRELANRMAERGVDVMKELMKLGTMATAHQSIDADTAELVVSEFGHKVRRVTEADVESVLEEVSDDPALLVARPPVVTVMGHVDHGKTSLLDALRETDVVADEAGGITQHIGAYQVRSNGQKITFIDTPGHEAFTAMRARGAGVTDIVILVVAADDGIKAQTEEAISHARAAEVPIIVAINKIDKPDADPARVKNELMQHELVPEEFGGDVQTVDVSAKEGTGLDALKEAVLLQAEVLELQANPECRAQGAVIEARVEKGRGVVATLLVEKGTLRVGDVVVAGAAWGRVRAMNDDQGRPVEAATPAQPVEVLGFGEAPLAGDPVAVVSTEKSARDIAEYRVKREKERRNIVAAKSLDQMFAEAGGEEVRELLLVIKGDVQGSIEAIISSVEKFNGDEVSVKTLHSGVGAIAESDVALAQATGAIIIGFNVRAAAKAREMAAKEKIDIRYYSVIYDLVDDVKAALSGMLSPERRETQIGYAEIRQVFSITKVGKIAGCMVTEGLVKRGAGVRLLRDNVVIHEGKLKTLKRFKDEVKEAKSGYECGMAFENYEDIREGDVIECFEVEEIARTLDDKQAS